MDSLTFSILNERDALCGFLDVQRAALLRKVEGVSDSDARKAPTASSLSLLGLLKHSALWERRWFQVVVAGRTFPGEWPESGKAAWRTDDFLVGEDDTVAQWASCYNDQPWNYIVATREDPAGFGKMLACLMAGNQAWAKTAPVLAISVARTRFRHDGSLNLHAQHDLGAASASLAMEAESLDLAVHQMGGFDAIRARDTYHIPADHDPMAAMAIGYPGDPSALPDKLREREMAPRSRRPISEFVYSGDWGSVATFLKDAR